MRHFKKDWFYRASEEGVDLVRRLLVFNPRKRISLEEALSHPYVREYRNTEE
jgi:serine/threonine protein kinase